jgi:hypothetical protein
VQSFYIKFVCTINHYYEFILFVIIGGEDVEIACEIRISKLMNPFYIYFVIESVVITLEGFHDSDMF